MSIPDGRGDPITKAERQAVRNKSADDSVLPLLTDMRELLDQVDGKQWLRRNDGRCLLVNRWLLLASRMDCEYGTADSKADRRARSSSVPRPVEDQAGRPTD